MKAVILLSLLGLVLAGEADILDYHGRVGIPLAEKIRKLEANSDFDGSRIAGGSPAALGQYPFMAGLLIRMSDGHDSVCGSTLISNTRLVTAAHCWVTSFFQATQFTVVLGTVRLFSGGVRVVSRDVVVHSGWRPPSLHNDIAIIRTSWISYTNVIQPVALPSGSQLNNNFAGAWAQAIGFGITGQGHSITVNQVLSHVSVQVITNAVCLRTHGPMVIASTICTSGEGGRNTCNSDSGGPVTTMLSGQRVLGVAAGMHRINEATNLALKSSNALVTDFEQNDRSVWFPSDLHEAAKLACHLVTQE